MRIVDRRSDVGPDQLDRHVAAPFVGNIGELAAGALLDGGRDDLVLRLRAGAAHLEFVIASTLDRLDVVGDRLVGGLRVHPKDEVVEREHRNRGEIFPAERDAGRERGGEEVRQRDDDLVLFAVGGLHFKEAFGARTTRFVDDDHRLVHQRMLLDNALKHPGHLIGAAAAAGRHDELDSLGRRPLRCGFG